MNVVLFSGSPRVRSNTRSIVHGLRKRLEREGASVQVLDPKRDEEASEAFLSQSVELLKHADVLVLAAPVYLDLPPYKTLSWLHAVLEQQDSFHGCSPAVYAICHSGYFEPIHKQVSLHAMEHFCRRMEWTWCGGLSFGGTSPIDGKALEDAGPFSRRVRPALDALVRIIIDRTSIPSRLIAQAQRRPIPLPRRFVVWLMNRVIQRST